jgi:O-antigen ligase
VALLASRRGTGAAFRRLVGVLVATVVFGTIAVLLVVPPATTQRALSIFTGKDESGDSATRFQLWSQAIDYLPTNPIRLATGVGTGSFAALSPDQDYPHNIALETLLEQGVVGFLALVIFLVVTFRKSWRLARLPGDEGTVGSLVFALAVFAVTAAMFSGDIAANGSVFLWAGVVAGMVARARATPAPVAAAVAADDEPEPPRGALLPTPEGV